MPTYDYHCQACNSEFSAMHKISDPVPDCPQCGATRIKKKVAAPAVMGARLSAQVAPAAASGGHGCAMGGCGCRPQG